MNAEKYTQKTLDAVKTAQSMAQENGNQYLTPEHLLYALVDQDGGLIASLFGKMGVDCDGLLSELDTKKGVGLIERIKQGQGKPTKIYVKRFTTRELPADTAEPSPQCPDTGRGADLDFSDFQTSEKSMSRPRQTRCADLGKADASYPNRNKPEFSYPDPSIRSHEMEMERCECRKEVMEQINYVDLQKSYPYDDVDCLLELIVDTLCSTAATMRIGGDILPASAIKERYRQLDAEHIRYVIDGLRQTTTQIRNIRAYLLTTLYNAPLTIENYYAAQINHDLYGRNRGDVNWK